MGAKALRIFLIILILGGSIGLLMAMVALRDKPASTPVTAPVPLVEVVDLVPSNVRFSVASQGVAQPAVQTQISAEVSGTIVSVSPAFVAGGRFAEDETLAQIDPVLFEAAVQRAEAVLRQRQVEYDGAKALDARNYRSAVDMAAAEAALSTARADLVRARNDLDKTRIRLPYAGIVRQRSVDIGQFVAAGSPLGSAFGSDRVEVRLPLSQDDLRFLDLPAGAASSDDGGPTVVLTGRYRGEAARWTGRIVRTEATIDETNRMSYAVAEIADPYRRLDQPGSEPPLPVGTFVAASIPGREIPNVLSVPRYAVRGDGQLVFADSENQVRVRDVALIHADRELAYIDAASVEERRLIVTTLESPINGQTVRIADAPTAETAD